MRALFLAMAVVAMMPAAAFADDNMCASNVISGIPQDCTTKDRPFLSWMGSGTNYAVIQGNLSSDFCALALVDGVWTDRFDFAPLVDGKTETFKYADCAAYTAAPDKVCFVADRATSNGNSWYYWVVIADAQCDQGLFFNGDKYNYRHDKPVYEFPKKGSRGG